MKQPWQQQQDAMRRHQQQQWNQVRQQQEIQQYQMRKARQKNEVLRQPQEQRQHNDPFARVESEAIELREAHATGRVSDQELQDRLGQLMVEDERGTWWTIDLDSLTWVRYDGTAWVQDLPARPAVMAGAYLDDVRLSVHPRISAFLGTLLRSYTILVAVFLVMWIGVGVLIEANPGTGNPYLIPFFSGFLEWAVFLGLLIVAMLFMKVRTTTITIDQEQLQTESGILRKRVSNVELWRIEDLQLEQSFLQRLTKDGTLVVRIGRDNAFKLAGLANMRDLEQLHQKLLNVVVLPQGNQETRRVSS